jgi:acetylornithine aminotransferase
VIERDGLLARASDLGAQLVEEVLALNHPAVTGVRGRGLLQAITLAVPVAPAVADAALDAGFIVNAPKPDVLRLAPPLIIGSDQLSSFVATLPGLLDGAVLVSKGDDPLEPPRRAQEHTGARP